MACWLEITAGHGLRFSEARRLAAIHFAQDTGTIKFPTKGGDVNELPATEALQRFFARPQLRTIRTNRSSRGSPAKPSAHTKSAPPGSA